MQRPVTILSQTQQPEIVNSNTFDTKFSLRTQIETGLFSGLKVNLSAPKILNWFETGLKHQ